jgi:hypothetical protein
MVPVPRLLPDIGGGARATQGWRDAASFSDGRCDGVQKGPPPPLSLVTTKTS